MAFASRQLAEYAAMDFRQVLSEFGATTSGLSQKEAERRLKEEVGKRLLRKKRFALLFEFLSHFNSPLIIILLIAAGVSAFFDEIADAFIIVMLILFSVVLDFFLEHNAEEAAAKLRERVRTNAIVIRDDIRREVGFEGLCKGDVIFLNAGSLIPADARVIESNDLFANQSALTGESYPCGKQREPVKGASSLGEMKNILFFGTSVVSGSATAVVVSTGKETEFGKIAARLEEKPEESEFDRGINKFGILITKAIVGLVLFIFLFNSLLKHEFLQSFLFAIAVAVGLTPELLPMILSVTLAKGSMRMAKDGVIVKKLPCISNLGSMDVLCTDKTGTLTQDKIKLVKYTDMMGRHSESVLHFAYLNSYFQTGIKNVLDTAVIEFRRVSTSGYRKLGEIPFDFVRKKMSVIVRRGNKAYLVSKGAPEEMFKCSSYVQQNSKALKLSEKLKKRVLAEYHKQSKEGYRVLCVAMREIRPREKYSKDDERGMTLLGFVAFLDPPKEDVKGVIEELNSMGVEVKIITGDNELVTKKICDEIGIRIKGIMLGTELASLTDDALKIKAEGTTIFARFSPDEKNRIIHLLKSNGHVVGYMGDGINDAPSLRNADVGISVNSAVDVAKEAAAIVLTRKSLRVLKEGIIGGRRTFGNTMKYIMMNLSSNFGNMFSYAGSILLLRFLPMLPIQVLLNNFIYDFSQITIPNDNVDADFIKKPRRWDMSIIKKFMFVFGPTSSFFDFLTFFLLAFVLHVSVRQFQTGWFMESLATQTLIIHIIRTKKTPFIESRPSMSLLVSSIICVIIGWVLPFTSLGYFLGFEPLPFHIILMLAGVVGLYMITVELVKKQFYKHCEY